MMLYSELNKILPKPIALPFAFNANTPLRLSEILTNLDHLQQNLKTQCGAKIL